jgi:hypothetical protein
MTRPSDKPAAHLSPKVAVPLVAHPKFECCKPPARPAAENAVQILTPAPPLHGKPSAKLFYDPLAYPVAEGQ